jgi:hypothetical protein
MRTASRHARRTCSPLFEPIEPRLLMAATPIDIEGVYNASLDQPRTYALFQRTPGTDPLAATDPLFGIETFTVEAFYDTGASGVLVSKETADAMGIRHATYNGQPVEFADVGVGGADYFDVSEPLYISLAPYGVERDLDNYATYPQVYDQTFGPLRTQIAQASADDTLGLMPLDVFGMPTMRGKVIVMDARPPSSDGDDFGLMRTYTYNPGTPYNAAEDTNDPGIPQTGFHVKLSYADFGRFTDVTPAGAPGPTLRHNPFIGPDPLRQLETSPPPDNTPGITITRGSKSFTGSWLFDTGAAASILSQHAADAVGVHYAPGTYHTDEPQLVDDNGNAIPDQFTLQIGGIGGSFTAAGFFLDSLVLPTQENQPIRYLRAPVLVGDISVADPHTGQDLTLDGVFGMNFLVASMQVNGTDLGDVSAGAYDWITFDEPNGVLGLNLAHGAPPPTPAVVGRHVFDNNSSFDHFTPGASTWDDGAIQTNKQALLPSQTATFANYTTSDAGITGIMVDVAHPANAAGIGADDFTVRVGNTATPSTWAAGPAPTVTVRPGAGTGGSDRVELTWARGKIQNQWVQVTLKANADTGLGAPDVFYFGNLPGDTGDSATSAVVNALDLARTRAQVGRNAPADSPFDHRRDGRVNVLDLAAVRGNLFHSLRLITAPAATTASVSTASALSSDAPVLPAATRAAPPRRRAEWDEPADLLGRVG